MVYENLEIWRGVVLTRGETLAFMKTVLPREEFDRVYQSDIYSIRSALNRHLEDGGLSTTHFGKCCSTNTDLIIGQKIKRYPRAEFSWEQVPPENRSVVTAILEHRSRRSQKCGKTIPNWTPDPEGLTNRCGYYVVCNRCLGLTTNGYYDVHKIIGETVECKTYCLTCNRDGCDKIVWDQVVYDLVIPIFGTLVSKNIVDIKHRLERDSHLQGDQYTLTINQPIDGGLVDLGFEPKQIKNYYLLDDCLSCT